MCRKYQVLLPESCDITLNICHTWRTQH